MPILEIGLASAAVVAATTSYLVPLIISCVTGFVAVVGSFFVGKTMSEQRSAKVTKDLANLRRKQLARDRLTRVEAERMVFHTDESVQHILKQSKKHQQKFDQTITQFNQNLIDTSEATENLERVAESIQGVAHGSSGTMASISVELDRLKSELYEVNNRLNETQKTLFEKDQLLKTTLDKLTKIEEQMEIDNQTNGFQIIDLSSGMIELKNILTQQYHESSLKDDEIQMLKKQINQLTTTVKTLESTVQDLTTKLADTSDENQTRVRDIRCLLDQNKQLIKTIEQLSTGLKQQASAPEGSHQSTLDPTDEFRSNGNHLRLFK